MARIIALLLMLAALSLIPEIRENIATAILLFSAILVLAVSLICGDD